METSILILLSVFFIEAFVFYCPAYLLSYNLLKLDKSIGDNKLVIILVSFTTLMILITINFLPKFILSLFFTVS